jgi:hypothetical protein
VLSMLQSSPVNPFRQAQNDPSPISAPGVWLHTPPCWHTKYWPHAWVAVGTGPGLTAGLAGVVVGRGVTGAGVTGGLVETGAGGLVATGAEVGPVAAADK